MAPADAAALHAETARRCERKSQQPTTGEVLEIDGSLAAIARTMTTCWLPPGDEVHLTRVDAMEEPQADPEGSTIYGAGLWILRAIDRPHLVAFHRHVRQRRAREIGARHCVVRVPLDGWERWRDLISPEGYVQQVRAGAIKDLALGIPLSLGFFERVLVPRDESWDLVMTWTNTGR